MIEICVANPSMAKELLAIYAPYVEKTAISFEYEVPSVEEFRARMERTLQKYPYFVAKREGELLGYAYLSPFVGRAAYAWSAETTIYLRWDAKRQRIGRLLYEALEEAARRMGILNLNACIGDPIVEDETLTRNSLDFHARMGYALVGTFHSSGYKFGRWYNMTWMEKQVGEYVKNPVAVRAFSEIDWQERKV